MTVLHTIASSGDDEAEATDSSASQRHIERVDTSSDELETLEAESVAAAGLQLPPQTLGCASFGRAARPPRAHRRQPGRHVLLLNLQCDLFSFLTDCLIVERSQQFLSVLKSVMLLSPRAGRPFGYRRSARRNGRTIDAPMTCARSDLAPFSSGGTLAGSSHQMFLTT